MPVTDEALDKLNALEKAETLPPEPLQTQAEDEIQTEQHPASGEVEADKTPDKSLTDTLATADKPKLQDKQETQPKEDKRSDFAKNADRLDKTWKAVNERKTQLDAKEAEIKAKETAIQQQTAKFEEKQAQSRSKVTPEQHEAAATSKAEDAKTLQSQAELWDTQAEKLEGDGKYKEAAEAKSKADDYRDQANDAKAMARLHKKSAETLRASPDPTYQQIQARNQQHLQHYTVEAAKPFPDLVVTGSEFQKKVVQVETQLRESGVDVNEYPIMRYRAAEFVAAQSAAARVPDLEKKLGEAEAKVKELEALSSPGGGTGSAQQLDQTHVPSEDDEREMLREAARNQRR